MQGDGYKSTSHNIMWHHYETLLSVLALELALELATEALASSASF